MPHDLKKATLQELREQTKDLTVNDTRRVYAAALDVTDLDEDEAELLAICQRLIRDHRSIDTPIEDFLWHLLISSSSRPLTLEDIKQQLSELEMNWADAVATARTSYAQHRDLVISPDGVGPAAEGVDGDD